MKEQDKNDSSIIDNYEYDSADNNSNLNGITEEEPKPFGFENLGLTCYAGAAL
jgi:hypothetical protein